MLAVISPAKKLNFDTEAPPGKHSQPEFLEQSEVLVEMARGLSRKDLARTMKLSAPFQSSS